MKYFYSAGVSFAVRPNHVDRQQEALRLAIIFGRRLTGNGSLVSQLLQLPCTPQLVVVVVVVIYGINSCSDYNSEL